MGSSILEKCKQSQPMIQRIIETTIDDECMLFEALSLNEELQQIISKFSQLDVCSTDPHETNTASSASPRSKDLDKTNIASPESLDNRDAPERGNDQSSSSSDRGHEPLQSQLAKADHQDHPPVKK